MKTISRLIGVFIVAAVMLAGCARPEPKCIAPEDNAPHHYLLGMRLLEEGRIPEADTKFQRALYCQEDFGPGYAGLALVEAAEASGSTEPAVKTELTEKSYASLKKAYRNARTDEDEFAYYLAVMRVNTGLKPSKWQKKVEGAYDDARGLDVEKDRLLYYDGHEAADYFMGVAYTDAREFERARERFSSVLSSGPEGKWNSRAEEGWKKTDKIVRALAGVTLGDVGQIIALEDSVRRDEVAALLVDELKIDRLFAGRIPVSSGAAPEPELVPVDVKDNPFREEILTATKWGIRGLEPTYDQASRAYLFHPEVGLKRKEFALLLEDVVIKLTGDESIASAYFGHRNSPFPDVVPTSAWYNAIVTVTTRNLMETGLSGEFRPDEPVDGADALLAIRVLRQRLNIH